METKQVRVSRRYSEIVEGLLCAMEGLDSREALDQALLEWIHAHAPQSLIKELEAEEERKSA